MYMTCDEDLFKDDKAQFAIISMMITLIPPAQYYQEAFNAKQ